MTPPMTPQVETYSGKLVHLVNPDPETIDLSDIAQSLSKLSRYNGHTITDHGYSVAQHSVWVATAMTHFDNHAIADDAFKAALLHDAHEAYTGDIVKPLKQFMDPLIAELQNNLDAVIFDALRVLPPSMCVKEQIKMLDTWALGMESRKFMYSGGIGWNIPEAPAYLLPEVMDPLSPGEACQLFMSAWDLIDLGMGANLKELWI